MYFKNKKHLVLVILINMENNYLIFSSTPASGESCAGRQSLMEAAAHLAGRFLLTFTLSPFTSVAALSSMLAGECQNLETLGVVLKNSGIFIYI